MKIRYKNNAEQSKLKRGSDSDKIRAFLGDIENMKNDCNGYILKYYRIMNRKDFDESKAFDFHCWGWFDGLRVIKIKDFSDFQSKSLNFNASKDGDSKEDQGGFETDRNCFRQKLLIYNIDQTNNRLPLFEKKEGTEDQKKYKLIERPLLSTSIVNLTGGNEGINKFSVYLNNVKEKYFKDRLIYNIYGVLSTNSVVVACRCNNYYDIKKFICAIRLFTLTTAVYTALCASSDQENLKDYWIEENKVTARLQLSSDLRFSPNEVEAFVNEKSKSKAKLKEILSIGKSDYTFSYEFSSTQNDDTDKSETSDEIANFVDFILDKLYEEGSSDFYHILSSSTSFTYDASLFNNFIRKIKSAYKAETDTDSSGNTETKVKDPDVYFNKWMSLIEDDIKDKLSENFIFELNRLVLRAYQLLFKYKKADIDSSDIVDGVEGFLNHTKESARIIGKNNDEAKDPSYHLQSIILGLRSLNKLLDNREVNEFHDFEAPRSNLFFIGNSYKLIDFYSGFSKDVIYLLEDWSKKINPRSPKVNCLFLTTDAYSEVTVRRLFLNSKETRLLNARVPTELLYKPYLTMCMLAHELGHFAKIGWDRKLRNRYFMLCVTRALFINIEADSSINIDCNSFVNSFFAFYDSLKSYDENFTQFKQSLRANLKVALITSAKSDFYGNNAYERFLSELGVIINIIQDAFREAPSDVFMLKALEITEPHRYLDISVNYFVHMGYNCSKLGVNILLRLTSVLCAIHINNNNGVPLDNQSAYKEAIETIISASLTSAKNSYAEKDKFFFEQFEKTCACILNCLNRTDFLSICMPLTDFLNKIYNVMKEDENTKSDKFKNYVEFIRDFNNKSDDNFSSFLKLLN